ncbi:BMQ_0737 family morphogenetic spore coat protein [Bacillus timonensis]|uniref:hypothetical protein n=1 Tax=Bacillus timonensis TaxID=1033734 RepID=UPI000289B792|nr:hypothetical protein [Bacillus timonensis]
MSRNKHKETENVCIKTRKIYDWVTRQVEIPIINMADDKLDAKFRCHDGHGGHGGGHGGGGKGTDKIEKLCRFLEKQDEDFTVNCFLSDDKGRRIDPREDEEFFTCKEITPARGRTPVTVTLPNGDTVTLQRVKALVKGFVAIQIVNENGEVVCSSTGIPFATVQNFLLCAPDGTELDCHVSFFECDANLICAEDFQQLDVSLTLCLEVQIEADVKLEIEAKFCHPREEILEPTQLCPTDIFPPQCPEVFPAR